MFDSRPSGLHAVLTNASLSIAKLGALEGFSRSLVIGVMPLIALNALGSKEAVAQTYLLASLLTLLITLNFASLERLLKRRWVVTLGSAFFAVGGIFLITGNGVGFIFGIGLQSASASLFSICLSLYIMDYIGKRELARSESRRMVLNGVAWLIGPSLGIWLMSNVGAWSPFVLAIFSSIMMLIYFWWLRLGPDNIVRKAKKSAINPLRVIPRYFAQPALRIAYLITLFRSVFWMTLFIYCPIYVVESGMPNWVAGGMLSFVSGLLLASSLVRKLAERIGVKTVIISGLIIISLGMQLLFWEQQPGSFGLIYWVLAAIGGAMLDVLGNIPFMRMVKPRERTEMTMVFATWRESSQLLSPLLVTIVLMVAPFQVYYLVLSVLMLGVAVATSFLPKRL